MIRTRNRSRGGGASAIISSLSMTSLLPSTVTFGRATVHSVTDNNGAVHIAKSGEARFYGARRTENLVLNSEDFATGWTPSPGTDAAVAEPGVSLRTGRESIKRIFRASGSSNLTTRNSSPYRPGQHTFSVALATATGTDTIRLRLEDQATATMISEIDVVPPLYTGPASMRTYAISGVIPNTLNHRFTVGNPANATTTLYIDGAMIQYTHGRSASGLPDDYVPVGVTSSPWSGAGVDGVKYWDTTCGNSITAGLVTFAPGTAIPEDTLKGLMIERGTVNGLYSSRDLNDAQWTKSFVTAGALADSIPLGANSLRKMAEDSTTNTHTIRQDYRPTAPSDNTRMTISCYAKAGERDIVRMGFTNKAGTLNLAYFNLTTGVVSNISGGAEVEAYMYPVGDCYRLALTGSAGTGATAISALYGLAITAGTPSYLGVTGNGAFFGGFQFEPVFVATAYHGDTGAAATLTTNPDNAYMSASVIPQDKWEISCDFTPFFNSNSNNKQSWVYIWYSQADANNRFGAAIRPGLFGGFNDAGSDDWVYDHYLADSESTWDGVDLRDGSENAAPLTTKNLIVQLFPTAVNGASNIVGKLGSSVMTSTLGGERGVTLTPSTTYLRFGVNDANPANTTGLYHAFCIKNFKIFKRPVTGVDPGWYRSPSFLLNSVSPTFIAQFDRGRHYTFSGGSSSFPYTFSRASNATMFNSSGNLVWAPANLLLYSDDLTNAYWTKTDTTLSQDGTLAPSGAQAYLATEGTAGTAIISRQTTVPANTPFTYAVEIKKGNHQFCRIGLASGGESCMAWVDFDAGTITTATLGGTTTAPIQPSLTALADGWYRAIITALFPVTSPACFVISAVSSGSSTRVSNGTHYIGRFNNELYDGTAPKLPNVVTSGTAYYGPRLDYDPATLTARGLLVEQASTNTIANTQTLNQLNGTISTGDTYLGSWVSKRYTGDGTLNAHLAVAEAITPGSGEVRNVSAVVKMISGTRVQLATSISHGAADVYANFNLSTGTLVGHGAGSSNEKITHLGNNVYRLSLTYTTTAAASGGSVALYSITGDSDTRGPSNTSTDVFDVLFPVSSVGEFESSIIPTFGIAATRVAEIANISTAGWLTSNVGAFYGVYTRADRDLGATVYCVAATDGSARWIYAISGVNRSFDGTNLMTGSAYAANVEQRVVMGLISGNQRMSVNGAAVTTIAFDGTMTPDTTLQVGNLNGTATCLNGWIKELRYYPTAAGVSDAQLQALTT